MLANSYFAVYFPDNLIRLDNFQQPFNTQGRDFFTETSNKFTKYVNMYLRNTYVETDTGFLFEDISAIR